MLIKPKSKQSATTAKHFFGNLMTHKSGQDKRNQNENSIIKAQFLQNLVSEYKPAHRGNVSYLDRHREDFAEAGYTTLFYARPPQEYLHLKE
jgi:hypothetical protein